MQDQYVYSITTLYLEHMLNVSPFMLILLKSWLEIARPGVKINLIKEMDDQIIMVLITLKMHYTTQNVNKEKKSAIAQLKIGFHNPPILNATFFCSFFFGLGHQETDEVMGFIIKVNLSPLFKLLASHS